MNDPISSWRRYFIVALATSACGAAPPPGAATPAAPPTSAASTPATAPNAYDVTVAAPRHYKVLVDNAHVRVVECVLGPHEKDAMHTHAAGFGYVTQGGKMRVEFATGHVGTWEPKTGESGWYDAEGPHVSENIGDAPMSFVLVEVKSARM